MAYLAAATGIGSNRVVSSNYRFAGPFIVRLAGLGLALVGLLALLLVLVRDRRSLPGSGARRPACWSPRAPWSRLLGVAVLRRGEVVGSTRRLPGP